MTDLALDFFRLLAHDVRWSLLVDLVQSDWRVGELAAHLARPQNLVSYHLGLLREGGLVREQRSAADARDVYYSLDLARLADLYARSGRALHPALAFVPAWPAPTATVEPARVLFLCTHNSARSQMAEALLRHAAGPRVVVASAGSEPAGLHPLAVQVMAERGIDLTGHHSKALDAVAGAPWDRVISVCDRVREVCPVFPRRTVVTHWSIRDPAAVEGSEAERLAAFRQTADELARRVDFLLPLLAERGEEKSADFADYAEG